MINITDVDDKLIIEARERGISISELAEEVSAGYFAAMEELGVDSIDLYPRATEHISHIIELIQQLESKDAAYAVNGDVYFDITKCVDYGKLSNRKAADQLDGSRALAGDGKRNSADFALWKSASEDELGWDSPWGKGRPGWHIECSAMSKSYLAYCINNDIVRDYFYNRDFCKKTHGLLFYLPAVEFDYRGEVPAFYLIGSQVNFDAF